MLSTINGTLLLWAKVANFSRSRTSRDGFARVSPKTAFVLGLNAFCNSSISAVWSTKVTSMPNFLRVTANKLKVPPYIVVALTTWSPA